MARFSLKWLFVGAAGLAVAVTALVNANEWWQGAMASFKGCCITFAALYALFRRTPFAAGFAVTGVIAMLNDAVAGAVLSEHITDLIAVYYDGPTPNDAGFRHTMLVFQMANHLWVLCLSMFGGVVAVYLSKQEEGRAG